MTAFKRLNPLSFAALVAAIVIYVAVRLWGLTDSCLWFDEIFSVHAAEHAWNELFHFVALDLIHPPLFYVLLKLWIAFGGETLFWLRLLPVLFSVIAVIPFLLLCGQLNVAFWARVLGLFLLANNGSLIKYSQEVRMYSLLMCLSLFSMWLFVRFLDRGVGIIALTIVNLLMVYTHYFGWLVIAAEVVAILVWKPERWLKTFAMLAAVLVGFLPWLIAIRNAAVGGSSLGQNIGWMERPMVTTFVQFILNLIEPFYYQASSIDAGADYRIAIPILLIITTVFVVYLTNAARERDGETGREKLLAVFIGVPVILAFVASWLLPYSIWGTRHLIIIFAAVALLISIAFNSQRAGWLKTASLTLLLLFTGFSGVKYALAPAPAYSWCNWELQGLHAIEVSPARIYVLEDLPAYHVWFALHENGMNSAIVAKIRNVPGVTEDTAYFLPRGFDEIKTIEYSELRDNVLWLGYRAPAVDQTQQPLKTFVDAGYRVTSQSFLDAEHEQTIFLLLEKGT